MITSDEHAGIGAALRLAFPGWRGSDPMRKLGTGDPEGGRKIRLAYTRRSQAPNVRKEYDLHFAPLLKIRLHSKN